MGLSTDPIRRARQLACLELGKDARAGRLSIPPHASKLVTAFFHLLNRNHAPVKGTAMRAGLSQNTLISWRHDHSPYLDHFEAALNALGYELRIVKRYEPRDV